MLKYEKDPDPLAFNQSPPLDTMSKSLAPDLLGPCESVILRCNNMLLLWLCDKDDLSIQVMVEK